MKIEKWNKIYINNKRLDQIFYDKYKNDQNLFTKNVIELLVEIGEFVNETKIFKYWTSKQMNKEKALEEYADILTMILTFYGELNMEIKEPQEITNSNVLDIILVLYKKSSCLIDNFNKDLLEEIFNYTLHLGTLLNFGEDEILKSLEKKQIIIEKRLNTDY